MGLGFPDGEFASKNISKFNTTVQQMSNQGVIDSASFSLYLNDVEHEGNILFGGYDKAKYHGELQTMDLVEVGGAYNVCLVPSLGIGNMSTFFLLLIRELFSNGMST